jgi:hypothetical protein
MQCFHLPLRQYDQQANHYFTFFSIYKFRGTQLVLLKNLVSQQAKNIPSGFLWPVLWYI